MSYTTDKLAEPSSIEAFVNTLGDDVANVLTIVDDDDQFNDVESPVYLFQYE